MRFRVMELKDEYATEEIEQNDGIGRTAQQQATVYAEDVAIPLIPDEYLEEPVEV